MLFRLISIACCLAVAVLGAVSYGVFGGMIILGITILVRDTWILWSNAMSGDVLESLDIFFITGLSAGITLTIIGTIAMFLAEPVMKLLSSLGQMLR